MLRVPPPPPILPANVEVELATGLIVRVAAPVLLMTLLALLLLRDSIVEPTAARSRVALLFSVTLAVASAPKLATLPSVTLPALIVTGPVKVLEARVKVPARLLVSPPPPEIA